MSTLTEHNLLADLPLDFEIVAEGMDPEVPAVFYFVSQSLRRVVNYAYDCPCGPTAAADTHPPDQCPNPKLSMWFPPSPSSPAGGISVRVYSSQRAFPLPPFQG